MPKAINLFVAFVLFSAVVSAAPCRDSMPEYPVVGRPLPDYTFKEVEYFSAPSASIRSFRGKWLVLDFWSRICAVCVASFPGMDSIQKSLGDRLQVLLVGQDKNETFESEKRLGIFSGDSVIRRLYRRIHTKQHVDLPVAWDSVLIDRLGGLTVPYVIVIDPKGIVRAVTYHITKENLLELFAGGKPRLEDYRYSFSKSAFYSVDLPLLTNGIPANGGGYDTSFFYRSLLTRCSEDVPGWIFNHGPHRLEVIGVGITTLYRNAFFGRAGWDARDTVLYGKSWYFLELHTRDSDKFIQDGGDLTERFSYSLYLRPNGDVIGTRADSLRLQAIFQSDLDRTLPYTASVETKDCPIYRLIVRDSGARQRLATKGGSRLLFIPKGQLRLRNSPVVDLIRCIQGNIPKRQEIPIIDCTGIEGNIDIAFMANTAEISDIKEELKANGLELVPDKKPMKVLVIRDKAM